MNSKLLIDKNRHIWTGVLLVVLIAAAYTGRLIIGNTRRTGVPFYELESITRMAGVITLIAALVLAAYRFIYLHFTGRVDLYHSLPVSALTRFRSRYCRGIGIFAAGLLVSVICGVALGIPVSDIGAGLTVRLLMAGILTFLFFAVIYNISIFAITLSGNPVIGFIIDVVLIFYVDLWERVVDLTCNFATRSSFFDSNRPDISVFDIYMGAIYPTVRMGVSGSVNTGYFLRACIKLLIWFFVTYRLCRSGYLKRPAEASRSLVAFYSSHMLIKLMIVVPIALLMGHSTYDSFYEYRELMQIIMMILTAIVASVIIESVFSMSIRTALRKWGSIIVALCVIFIVFGTMRVVEKRYNAYVPEQYRLSTYAVFDPLDSYYYGFNICFDDAGYAYDYQDAAMFVKEHMYLRDAEAIHMLAYRSSLTDYHDMASPLPLQVYYRLTNGKNRSRQIWVDMDDDENRAMLNRIVGPAYYKEGIWQAFDSDVPEGANVTSIDYHDLQEDVYTHIGEGTADADRVVAAWREAMVGYDYDHVRYEEVAAEIEIHFDGGLYMWVLPLYADMDYNS